MKEQSQNVLVRNGEYKLVHSVATPRRLTPPLLVCPGFHTVFYIERRPHRHDRIARARVLARPGGAAT